MPNAVKTRKGLTFLGWRLLTELESVEELFTKTPNYFREPVVILFYSFMEGTEKR